MFKVGDRVIHPVRGAGVVERIVEREWRGASRRYYSISLLSNPSTWVMIPLVKADGIGLRPAVSKSKLKRVWKVLEETPDSLPTNYKQRFRVVSNRLDTGDIMSVVSAVRDLTWREQVVGRLTIQGGRLYKQALSMLIGEVAAVKGIAFEKAESRVRNRLIELKEEPLALDWKHPASPTQHRQVSLPG